ncbi:MAG TPA: PAS domain-containing sensor histidine kinase [Melioribacteraceae bacterium]|nr:PAS domain-containing sensor histidine kinase [Melioribacteraceae bacterium]
MKAKSIIENNHNTIEAGHINEANRKHLINSLRIISVLTIISGLFALIFEVKYFETVSIYVYACRFYVIAIAFWILILSNFEFGFRHPGLMIHTLLLSILISFGIVIVILPNTLVVNSQIAALIVFTSSIFLAWEVKDQIVVAIYYNLIFGATILINKSEIYILQNVFASVLFVMFLSVISIVIAAMNYKHRRNSVINTLRLFDSQKKYKEIFENSSDGIFQASLEGEVLTCNSSFKILFGVSENEEINLKDELLFGEKNFDQITNRLMHKNQLAEFKFSLKSSSKSERRFTLNCNLRNDSSLGKYIIEGTLRDVTAQFKIEEALRAAKEKAEESDKLKNVFLSQVSHEIRTPINAILSSIEYLREEMKGSENSDLTTTFGIIDNASKRIIRTIHLMLEIAELQSGTYKYSPSTFDLYSNCIVKIIKEFDELLYERKIVLNVHRLAKNPSIQADEYSVCQIFRNIIDNAVKYTMNGKIDIRVDNDDDGRLTINVKDTGVGISEEYLTNLYQVFTQEEQGFTRKFDGNGLGLTLVRKYCDLNNASVKITSKKQEGTEVKITFHNAKQFANSVISL